MRDIDELLKEYRTDIKELKLPFSLKKFQTIRDNPELSDRYKYEQLKEETLALINKALKDKVFLALIETLKNIDSIDTCKKIWRGGYRQLKDEYQFIIYFVICNRFPEDADCINYINNIKTVIWYDWLKPVIKHTLKLDFI